MTTPTCASVLASHNKGTVMTPSELADELERRGTCVYRDGRHYVPLFKQGYGSETDEYGLILSALRAADAVEGAKVALGNVVTAYAKANPLRRADFHPAECACQRCAVDHAKSALTQLETGDTK